MAYFAIRNNKNRKFLTPSRRNQIAWQQKWRCAGPCQELLPPTWCMDHIIALRDGGSNDLSNFQALCGTCHSLKTLQENQEYHDKKRGLHALTCKQNEMIPQIIKVIDLDFKDNKDSKLRDHNTTKNNDKNVEEKQCTLVYNSDNDDDDENETEEHQKQAIEQKRLLRKQQFSLLESFRFHG